MTAESTAPTTAMSSAPPSALSLRVGLVAVLLVAVLIATRCGNPAERYLADPALARLLRGMGMLKGLLTLGVTAVLWWRAASPGSARLALAALLAVAAQAAASIWILRLVAIPWAAALFHAGLAILLGCVWLEHRAELDRRTWDRRS